MKNLQHGKGEHPDSLFTILLPDNSLYPYTGKISVIDRAVDPQTGSIRVRLVFPNPKLTLKAGMSCVVREHNQETIPQMIIPGKAIVEQMGEYFVFVARIPSWHVNADTYAKKRMQIHSNSDRLFVHSKKSKVRSDNWRQCNYKIGIAKVNE